MSDRADSDATKLLETLERIDTKLAALLALQASRVVDQDEPFGIAANQRSVYRLLSDAGLSAREIAQFLGRSRSLVHRYLRND